MTRLHLHLLSDSTGETLEMIAKAALAQFDDADIVRHFWPMVRSQQHLDRIMGEIAANPGLVLFTLVNAETRERLEQRCAALGLPSVAALDAVTDALEEQLPVIPDIYQVDESRLEGMDGLWAAAVVAEDADVARLAQQLLLKLESTAMAHRTLARTSSGGQSQLTQKVKAGLSSSLDEQL